MSLQEEFLKLLESNANGISDLDLQNHFKKEYINLVTIINSLLKENRVKVLTLNSTLIYRAVDQLIANKLNELGQEHKLVYEVCEQSGNKGIWTKDIKNATKLSQHLLTKILKHLENIQLIKSVRSVNSKSKKLYMAFHVVPDKELTGGPWYTDDEFDQEFVNSLCKFIANSVNKSKYIDIDSIISIINTAGFLQHPLTNDELETVIQTLVYDNIIEIVPVEELMMHNINSNKPYYRSCKPLTTYNFLTNYPCGTCLVASQCHIGGVISPETCLYFTNYLNSTNTSMELF